MATFTSRPGDGDEEFLARLLGDALKLGDAADRQQRSRRASSTPKARAVKMWPNSCSSTHRNSSTMNTGCSRRRRRRPSLGWRRRSRRGTAERSAWMRDDRAGHLCRYSMTRTLKASYGRDAVVYAGSIGLNAFARVVGVYPWEVFVMAQKLTADARKAALAGLSGWAEVPGRDAIAKTFVFQGFQPGLRLHDAGGAGGGEDGSPSGVVQRLQDRQVTLSTHDAGGVTERDIKLAEAMDRIAG